MHKTKYELAREIVDEYHNAFLQGDTMLHIQEWIDEKQKDLKKNPTLKIEDGHVVDYAKCEDEYCDCCGSRIGYFRVSFSKKFIAPLVKILDHVIEVERETGKHTNIINIKDVYLTNQEYSNLNRIANFGLLYREQTPDGRKIKNGTYGVPQKRIFDFLNGDWEVAKYYVVKTTTGERILSKERVFISEIHMDDEMRDYQTKSLPSYVEYIRNDDIIS